MLIRHSANRLRLDIKAERAEAKIKETVATRNEADGPARSSCTPGKSDRPSRWTNREVYVK